MPTEQKILEVLYVRENAYQSIISDVFTFGCLMGLVTLNYTFWGGRWYLDIFAIIVTFIWLSARGNPKIKRFKSREEAVKYLRKNIAAEK